MLLKTKMVRKMVKKMNDFFNLPYSNLLPQYSFLLIENNNIIFFQS